MLLTVPSVKRGGENRPSYWRNDEGSRGKALIPFDLQQAPHSETQTYYLTKPTIRVVKRKEEESG